MNNEQTKASPDAVMIKLPELDGTIEEIPAADLDDVAGGQRCTGTCGKTEIKISLYEEL